MSSTTIPRLCSLSGSRPSCPMECARASSLGRPKSSSPGTQARRIPSPTTGISRNAVHRGSRRSSDPISVPRQKWCIAHRALLRQHSTIRKREKSIRWSKIRTSGAWMSWLPMPTLQVRPLPPGLVHRNRSGGADAGGMIALPRLCLPSGPILRAYAASEDARYARHAS